VPSHLSWLVPSVAQWWCWQYYSFSVDFLSHCMCVCYLPKNFCDEIIIIDPQFSVFRRENSSYKKPDHSSSSTVFIRCFDSALGEDQVVWSAKHVFLGTSVWHPYASCITLTIFHWQIRSSLLQHFSSGGEITRVSSPKDYETGASKG
jgi:hypothetical protein